MKVRKLAVALALAGALGAEMAHAVGLGQIKLESYLNQPLKAQINLLDVGDLSPDQIIVGLASNQDFSQAGIKRSYDLSNLKFKVVRQSNGNMVVNVTTKKPVHEPYMDFLVNLNWPNGRVMREYTLLVDPPTYEKGEQAAPVNAAPSAAESPAPRSQSAHKTAPATTASASVTSNSHAAPKGGGTYGPVKGDDTLWGIAENHKPSARVSTQQEMLAIQDQNPDAFVNGNINRMKRGHVLRLPTLRQAQSRSRHQAVREVIAQNRAFKSSRHPAVNATAAKGTSQAGHSAAAAGQDQLKLVVANKGKESPKGSHGGGNGGTSQASMRNKLAVTEEQVDKLQRDNADLNSRLQDLQDQVKTLKRLIELKNDQLTALQTEAGQKGKKAPANTSAQVAGASSPAASLPAAAASSPQGNAGAASPAMTSAPATPATSQPAQAAKAPASVKSSSQPEANAAAVAKPAQPAKKPAQPQTEAGKPLQPVHEAEHPRSFWGNLIHQLMSNPFYQLEAGAVGIMVLIGLWLLARRNAHHEKQFYENLKEAEEGESLDLGQVEDEADSDEPETEEASGSSEDDAVSEADVYIAYGRFDQAAHLLEEAISAEPSRTDLRLKLLETYAESGHKEAFDRQLHELEAIADDESLASARALRDQLQETEQGPSISDLESELKTGVTGSLDETTAEREETGTADSEEELEGLGIEWDLDSSAEEAGETGEPGETAAAESVDTEEDDLAGIDFDLGDLDSGEETQTAEEDTGETEDLDLSSLSAELDSAFGEEAEPDQERGIEYSLDTEALDEAETAEQETAEDLDLPDLDDLMLDTEAERGKEEAESGADEADEFGGIDFESAEDTEALQEPESAEPETPADGHIPTQESSVESPAEPDPEALTSEPDEGPIDESFLDELDAELDKVTGEDEDEITEEKPQTQESSAPESTDSESEGGKDGDEDLLGDLELDVSDEDLALLDEASRAGEEEVDEEESLPELHQEERGQPAAGEESETRDGHPGAETKTEEAGSGEQEDGNEEPLLDVDLDESSDALMEEGDALPENEWDDLELSDADLDLGEGDDLGLADGGLEEDEDTQSDDGKALGEDLDLGDTDLGEPEEPVEAEQSGEDESLLASSEGLSGEPEEDDFDFLAGTDEAATKLDLARAYIEMGDADGAKDILEEVSLEGTEEQKKEAQDMLKSIV